MFFLSLFLLCLFPNHASSDNPQRVYLGALTLGESQEQNLPANTIHVWTASLERDHFAEVVVRQKGIDVSIQLKTSDGELEVEQEMAGGWGAEEIAWFCAEPGTWSLELVERSSSDRRDYEIEWITSRPATRLDRKLVEAKRFNNKAAQSRRGQNHEEAERSLQGAIIIGRQVLGLDHPELATSLNSLGELNRDRGQFTEAERLYREALSIRKNSLGDTHARVGDTLNNLAILCATLGRYSESGKLFQEALRVDQETLGSDHPNVAGDLSNLAILYKNQGRFEDAEQLHIRAHGIRRQSLGGSHPDVAMSLSNRADVLQIMGRFAEAEELYLEALSILRETLGPRSGKVLGRLINLSVLYRYQGRLDEAEKMQNQVLDITIELGGAGHPRVGQSLNNLAVIHELQGRETEAEAQYKEALSIRESAFGPEHLDVAWSLSTLATLYDKQGRFSDGIPLQTRALSIRRKVAGDSHPLVAESLVGLASLQYHRGDYEPDELLLLLDDALAILDVSPGYPLWRMTALSLRAQVLKDSGDSPAAIDDLADALSIAESIRPQVGGGEETRAVFFENYATDYDRMVEWLLEAGDRREAFDYAERRRARVLLDQLAICQVDLRHYIPPEQLVPLEKRELEAKAKIAEYHARISKTLSRKDLSKLDRQERVADLNTSLQEADGDFQRVYEEIKNASPLWRDTITLRGEPAPFGSLRSDVVPPGGMLLLYHIGTHRSRLFVIAPRDREPTVYDLNVSEQQSRALGLQPGHLKAEDLRRLLLGDDENQKAAGLFHQLSSSTRGVSIIEAEEAPPVPDGLETLRSLLVPDELWQKLLEASEVVLIPDRALHYLPFEALVVETDSTGKARYWLDDGPVLRYGPSATTLYNMAKRPRDLTGLMATGLAVLSLSDPVYDTETVHRALLARETPMVTEQDPVVFAASLEGVTRGSYLRAGGSLTPLPGTALETAAIRKVFEGLGASSDIKTLSQLDATESQLRQALPQKPYIHLATHGLVDQRRGIMFSALALTPKLEGSADSENDGFLQLFEIYDMKLPSCQLAVLSACETNIGPAVEGEGVFALSRGFLAAGARRVVASQWNVDDASTAELMGAFFRNVGEAEKSGQAVDYAAALRDAKTVIRSQEQWSAPFYWAPFVLTGLQ